MAQANAPELLDNMLEENSVDELWVFFPDPWHKSRHHKRRLVSPAFADKVARVLKPGGIWRLATDWEEYALVMREVLEAHPDFENVNPGAVRPRRIRWVVGLRVGRVVPSPALSVRLRRRAAARTI